MNTFLIRAIGAVALVGMLSGCEDDEEKYRSEPPLVADMVVTSLKDGSSNIHVGDKFTVTLVQKKKGRLLNASKYSWSSTPSGLAHKNALQSVIYDQESQNPVDTLTADAVGDYRINFQVNTMRQEIRSFGLINMAFHLLKTLATEMERLLIQREVYCILRFKPIKI